MSSDPLDPAALVSRLPRYLPASSKTLKSPQDAITMLVHSAMSALEFRLLGIEESAAAGDLAGNVLPEDWNKSGPGHYTLVYKHEQSSLNFVMHVSKLGSRTMINAIASESDKAASMDVSTEDFTSPSFFPHDLTATNAPPLVHGFIGSNRVTDFINRFKLTIIQRLVPGLRKDGYSEVVEDASSNSTAGASQPRASGPAPARPQPHAPPAAPERTPYSHIPPTNPLEIGRRDRDPFPANPFAPPPLFPGADGGGMFVGPDHPIFGARGGGGLPGQNPFGAPRGPWGGDGFLPPMGAPPGARFDPVGPGPFPGAFPGSGNPLGGPRGGFPGRGNPDNDEFMPPGNMYM